MEVKLTNEQKLIATMLAEIHKKLDIRDGVNANLVAKALWSDNEWAIVWAHSFLLEQTPNPPHVKHVVDVLDMWSFIETAYKDLSPEEKERFRIEAYAFGEPSFPGFDGNYEGEYMSAASFLVDELGRFQSFAGRANLNSHSPTIEISNRMLSAFLPIRKNLGERQMPNLTLEDLIAIFKERVHPEKRAVV